MAELKLTIDANKALRDAVAHLRAVLDWSNTERFAGRTRHENDAPSSARSFLDGLDELQTSPKTSKDLDLCDECGCIGLCDPRCSLVPVQQDEPGACEHIWVPSGEASRCYSCNAVKCPVPVQQDAHPSELDPLRHIAHDCKCNHVPVQQDEPEGVCAFPNCSCTENRCPAKGERGPFCDHGFHPRLCGRCAPVPEAVTDEATLRSNVSKQHLRAALVAAQAVAPERSRDDLIAELHDLDSAQDFVDATEAALAARRPEVQITEGTINGEPYKVPDGYECVSQSRYREGQMALNLLRDLSRSEHGRCKGDAEFQSESGFSAGNPILPPGTHIGYSIDGAMRIVVPSTRHGLSSPKDWYEARPVVGEETP